MKKKIIVIIVAIIVIVAMAFLLIPPANPYGDGNGDITIMGATFSTFFGNTETYNDIEGLKIWHQKSERGNWIEYRIAWVGDCNALESFVGCCDEDNKWYNQEYPCVLETYNEDFFKKSNLVLILMTEGVLTTGMSVDSITPDGIINMTRTQFCDRVYILLGIRLFLTIEVDKSIAPDTMSVNMRTVKVRR